jgi:hypothetical protein
MQPHRKARGHDATVALMRHDDLFAARPNTAAEDSDKVDGRIRTLALPFVGLAFGALPGAAYAALVGVVHLALYGRWDRVPAFAAGCVAVTAAVGLTIGACLAISRRSRSRAGKERRTESPVKVARLSLYSRHRRSADRVL